MRKRALKRKPKTCGTDAQCMRQTLHGQPRKSMENPTGSREQKHKQTNTAKHKKKAERIKEHGPSGPNAQCIRQSQHGATCKSRWLNAIAQELKQQHEPQSKRKKTCEAGPSETSHNTELRRQIGKAKQLNSCSVTKKPEGKLGSEQTQNREAVQGATVRTGHRKHQSSKEGVGQ